MVSVRLRPPMAAALVPARAAESNHKSLLRIRNPRGPQVGAAACARDLRDALDEAVSGWKFRDLPLRVSIELSPQRRERLRAFFQLC